VQLTVTGPSGDTGLKNTVCRDPPGKSTSNEIKHGLFKVISLDGRSRSLSGIRTIVELIAATGTETGLIVREAHDPAGTQSAGGSATTTPLSPTAVTTGTANGTTMSSSAVAE
jgi:hypothetical protein